MSLRPEVLTSVASLSYPENFIYAFPKSIRKLPVAANTNGDEHFPPFLWCKDNRYLLCSINLVGLLSFGRIVILL